MTASGVVSQDDPEHEYDNATLPLFRPRQIIASIFGRLTRPIILCLLLSMVTGMTAATGAAPHLRILESIVCLHHYQETSPDIIQDGQVEERYCKVPAIQERVTLLMGVASTLENIPDLLRAVPLGALMDHYGRKPMLLLVQVGFTLEIAWFLVACEWPVAFSLSFHSISVSPFSSLLLLL